MNQIEELDKSVPMELRVAAWLITTFGINKTRDIKERNFRFIEEALELTQSLGLTKTEVLNMVNYVYNRPSGMVLQEVGGVVVTLAALCYAINIDMLEMGNIELMRIILKTDEIKKKQLNKPDSIKTK